jgi:hypothetical protein
MRFKHKTAYALDGDIRYCKKFAFIPVDIDQTDFTVWLEFYWVRQRFHIGLRQSQWITTKTAIVREHLHQ